MQLELPNNWGYITAFLGQMLELTKWVNWEKNPAHYATQVATVMRNVYENILIDNCPLPALGSAGAGGDELIMLRQNPDNPCLLETSVDGVTWCVWADLSKCTPTNTVVPPSKNPAPGACATYHVQVIGGAPVVLPTPLSTGDTIALSSSSGASNDGNLADQWYCSDGSKYFLGACNPPVVYDSFNLVPGAGTGSPILKLGASFYALSATPFTIPAGHTNEQGYIVLNYHDTSLKYGIVDAAISICKAGASGSWCKIWDFTLSSGGWTPYGHPDANGQMETPATWVPGQGWTAVNCMPPPATTHEWVFWIELNLGAIPATLGWSCEIQGHMGVQQEDEFFTIGVDSAPNNIASPQSNVRFPTPPSNTPFDSVETLNGTPYQYLRVFFQQYSIAAPTEPPFYVSSLKITGTGINPFGSSNC